MLARDLGDENAGVRLVAHVLERDAALGVGWLNGKAGHTTQALMGNAEKDIANTALEAEQKRIQGFIDRTDQLNWAIECKGDIIGALWVDLEDTDELKAPALHLMIGDKNARGSGVSGEAIELAVQHVSRGHDVVYSRHLISNTAAASLFENHFFELDGNAYTGSDGLQWQNVYRD